MSAPTHFPVRFLTVGKAGDRPTAPGLYLRWFVKPYLGVVGISPLHPSKLAARERRALGFRLFYDVEFRDIPPLKPLPLDPVLPRDRDFVATEVWQRPGWRAFYSRETTEATVELNLLHRYKHAIGYLRFNYELYADQSLTLSYSVHSEHTHTTTVHQVPLHYRPLTQALGRGQHEELSYAIHVDQPDESITEISFISDGSLAVGDFFFADRADGQFYLWSPSGGGGEWKEIESDQYLLRTLSDPAIRPAEGRSLIRAMTEFYDMYYGVPPHDSDGNGISFFFPELPQFQLTEPLTREYIADQYDAFCRGNIERGRDRFYIPPQDAAALASSDPAIAYLMGLFRVLGWSEETRQERRGPGPMAGVSASTAATILLCSLRRPESARRAQRRQRPAACCVIMPPFGCTIRSTRPTFPGTSFAPCRPRPAPRSGWTRRPIWFCAPSHSVPRLRAYPPFTSRATRTSLRATAFISWIGMIAIPRRISTRCWMGIITTTCPDSTSLGRCRISKRPTL